MAVKPFKERVKIYLMVLAFGLIGILGLLVSGYDYSRPKGFFLAEKREAMSFSESLMALPNEYIWFAVAFIFIIFIVELIILIAVFIKAKFR